MSADELDKNTELLNAELPSPHFTDTAYLRWCYEDNPYGSAIQRGVDVEGRRVAHYAIIPQRYRDSNGVVECAFSLNAVVRDGHQREGWFSRIGLEIYDEAAAKGWRWVVGVSNERSVGAVTKYMGWKSEGPLPVKICRPLRLGTRGIEHHRVDATFLDSDVFTRLGADLDESPAIHLTNCWTAEELRWRLASPHARYTLHVSEELVGVSTRTHYGPVPVAVLLKFLPRAGRTGPLDPSRMIAAICNRHRAPAAVYAGFNVHVPVRGLRPPRHLQPSPLHLILRHLATDVDRDALELDTFEFLDFDAY